jgi:hypothetical protein
MGKLKDDKIGYVNLYYAPEIKEEYNNKEFFKSYAEKNNPFPTFWKDMGW